MPQANPGAGYLALRSEIDEAVARVLASGSYVLGDEVSAFEGEFAQYIGTKNAVALANGTDAVELALRACGVQAGDVVATVSLTATATAAAIRRCGAHPLFVDVEAERYTMDVNALEEAFAAANAGRCGRIAAVVPVHLYGCPADMPSITRIAAKHGTVVIEDCAQAHGAVVAGGRVGSWGDAAAFSFYPTKNLPVFGDGGMMTTGDADIAERVRRLREYGWQQRYVSAVEGCNSRLDELQAAVARIMLRALERRNQQRRDIAGRYNDGLRDAPLDAPVEPAQCVHVYHQYVVRTSRRDILQAALKRAGVGSAIHYPVPIHRQPAYADAAGTLLPLPVTEDLTTRILSLPMFPELDGQAVQRVIDEIHEACSTP